MSQNTLPFPCQRVRKALTDRKQGESQTKNEERQTQDDEQPTAGHRQQASGRFLKDEDLKNGDDEDDRQQIAQAAGNIVGQGGQRILQFGFKPLPTRR